MDFRTEIKISASAEKAWDVLGQQYASISDWSASLVSSSLQGTLGVGAIRACKGVGFGPFPPGEVSEKLTKFEPENYEFSYVGLDGLPSFIKQVENTWSIESIDEKNCVVRSHASIVLAMWLRPLGWLLPWLLKRDMRLFTEELKYRIERGKPHPRKIALLSESG